MTVERVLLIRHGQTDWNAQKRWQGMIHHVTLNQQGRAEAHALGAHLAKQGISRLFSSDLQRAWETASIVGDYINLAPQADVRWREVNAGLFQGRTWAEMEAQFPEHVADFRNHSGTNHELYRFPNGESWSEVQARAYAGFEALVSPDNGPVAAVVSHGGTLRRLLERLFPEQEVVGIGNTSITTLERAGAAWSLRGIAATPHLPNGQNT